MTEKNKFGFRWGWNFTPKYVELWVFPTESWSLGRCQICQGTRGRFWHIDQWPTGRQSDGKILPKLYLSRVTCLQWIPLGRILVAKEFGWNFGELTHIRSHIAMGCGFRWMFSWKTTTEKKRFFFHCEQLKAMFNQPQQETYSLHLEICCN